MKAIGFKVFVVIFSRVFKVKNKQLVKHGRGFQWRQQNDTNEVVLVTLLLNFKKSTFFTFLGLNEWIPDGRLLFENLFSKQIS